jgi:hypothetical protein
VRTGVLKARVPGVGRGLAGRDAEVLPVGSPQHLGEINDLADVVGHMSEGPMQGLMNQKRLAPDPTLIRIESTGGAA